MGIVKLRFTSSLLVQPTIMLVKHYLITYKQLLESTQMTTTKPYLLYLKDTIYPLGTMLSYCHVFLTFFQTLTGFVNLLHFHTLHLPSSLRLLHPIYYYFIIYYLIYYFYTYFIYWLTLPGERLVVLWLSAILVNVNK